MNAVALTAKDIRTAKLLASGNSRKQIARLESVSLSSINSRVDALLYKTQSNKAIEAAHKLAKCGLIALMVFTLTFATDLTGQRRARRPALRLVRYSVRV